MLETATKEELKSSFHIYIRGNAYKYRINASWKYLSLPQFKGALGRNDSSRKAAHSPLCFPRRATTLGPGVPQNPEDASWDKPAREARGTVMSYAEVVLRSSYRARWAGLICQGPSGRSELLPPGVAGRLRCPGSPRSGPGVGVR